jgi:hypothetical protein
MVDAVVDHGDVVRLRSSTNQLGLDLLRHGDHARESGEQSFFDRIVEPFIPAPAGESVRSRKRNDGVHAGERPCKRIGLVVVGVDDVDPPFARVRRNAGQIR